MNNENYMMYEFKGRVMKELSKRLTKRVNINIFYKEDGNFVGIILSIPDCRDDSPRLYKIEDPWKFIQNNIPVDTTCSYFVEQYKNNIMMKYFKRQGRTYEKE